MQKNIVLIILNSFYISLIYIFWDVWKKYYIIKKKAILRLNKCFIMNLKERGITVGDLLIILIIIITSTVLIKLFSNDKKTTLNYSNQEHVSYKQIYFHDFIWIT